MSCSVPGCQATKTKAGLCNKHSLRLRRYGSTDDSVLSKQRQHTKEDVWKFIKSSNSDSCWPFTGYVGPDGYGQFSVMGKNYQAHVVAYMTAAGVPLGGQITRHACNNPTCCNPAHLIAGTYSQNSQDAVRAGAWKPGISGVVGVRYDAGRKRWLASARYEQHRYNLYQGYDFFEACCARKSWDAKIASGWTPL